MEKGLPSLESAPAVGDAPGTNFAREMGEEERPMAATEEVSDADDRITRPDIPGLVIPAPRDDEGQADSPSGTQRIAQPTAPTS
jgi:hypothetical protein